MAKDCRSFEPHRGMDVLTIVLGNPKHHNHIRGMSSRMSWKEVDSWQSNANMYHTRQRYKEGLR
jgi:hypothetical protein